METMITSSPVGRLGIENFCVHQFSTNAFSSLTVFLLGLKRLPGFTKSLRLTGFFTFLLVQGQCATVVPPVTAFVNVFSST